MKECKARGITHGHLPCHCTKHSSDLCPVSAHEGFRVHEVAIKVIDLTVYNAAQSLPHNLSNTIQYNAQTCMVPKFSGNPSSVAHENESIWQYHIRLEFQVVNRVNMLGTKKGKRG